MKWLSWLRYLIPKDEETEPGFGAELERLSVIGLRAIAIVCIGATATMFLIGSIFFHGDVRDWLFPLSDASVISIGAVALGLSFSRRVSGWARILGMLVRLRRGDGADRDHIVFCTRGGSARPSDGSRADHR